MCAAGRAVLKVIDDDGLQARSAAALRRTRRPSRGSSMTPLSLLPSSSAAALWAAQHNALRQGEKLHDGFLRLQRKHDVIGDSRGRASLFPPLRALSGAAGPGRCAATSPQAASPGAPRATAGRG